MLEGTYEPSPWEPIAEQVTLFESSNGAEGNELNGAPCIILTTKGAKSGNLRKTPLMRVTDGASYAVVGSMGGAPNDPQWVHNLRAHPEANLQDGPTLLGYTVREVEADEKAAWWARCTEVWPAYDTYQAATERVIPVFVLDPEG